MNDHKRQHYDVVFKSDIATIGLLFDDSQLVKVDYLNHKKYKAPSSTVTEAVKNKIENYLSGAPNTNLLMVNIKLNVTPFQKKVLEQLNKIPFGETRTYGDIAKILKTSPRAVGNACRNNPVPIIIPCHRVIAANGIGGYDGAIQGNKLSIKHKLLKLEGLLFT